MNKSLKYIMDNKIVFDSISPNSMLPWTMQTINKCLDMRRDNRGYTVLKTDTYELLGDEREDFINRMNKTQKDLYGTHRIFIRKYEK